MEEFQVVIQSLGALPYGGLFIFFLIVNVFVPIPEELFILGLGYIGKAGLVNLFIVIPIAVTGLIISDIVLFLLVRAGNKFLLRLGNRLFGDLTSGQEFLGRHVKKIIFFSRFVMAFRFIGPFSAGILKISLRTFILYDLSAIIILVISLSLAGAYFHHQVEKIISGIGTIKNLAFIGILAMLFLAIVQILRRQLFKILLIRKNENCDKNNKNRI